MIIILGLIIFVAAVVVGVAGVLGNGGGAHGPAHGFSVLGYHVSSSGTVFLYGIAVGAVALFGLWLLLAGARVCQISGVRAFPVSFFVHSKKDLRARTRLWPVLRYLLSLPSGQRI